MHACLISIQAIHKHFFFNLISLHFSSSSCSSSAFENDIQDFILFCLYNAGVFVGLKKLWIWEKSSSHCTCYFGTATCSLHISLLRFFFLYFISLPALLLLCRHVEAPFCLLCAVKNNGMKDFFIIKYVADSSFIIIKFSFILLILMCIHHSFLYIIQPL